MDKGGGLKNNLNKNLDEDLNGDWGLGIGQSPIPNPQSPIPILQS